MRALGVATAVGEDSALAAQGDAALAGLPLDAAAAVQAQDSVAKDGAMGALLERISAHAGTADADPNPTDGPNLYANTRDVIATTAGAVSSSPEAVRAAVGSPRWANELGSRLVMMSVRGQQEGSLSLTPEHLGPLEVRISISQDTTNIWFGAQHADTRAALTEAIPRLREMLAASGLALGEAGVSHDMPRQEARRSEFTAITGADNSATAETAPVALAVRRVRAALLDAWA
jgi:flagellar hook-length control protein FliK